MFGKGQGALSAWLKEFCQLVFIQTLQAFVYAIIIMLIVELLMAGHGDEMAASDFNTGLGMISVIALVSVFKVEDLVRKIFGFGPTKADHGGAVRSIAKTAFAMQLGKRVLDNGKKVFGGAGRLIKSNKDAAKARKQLKEDMSDLKLDMTGNLSGDFKDDFGSAHAVATAAAGGSSVATSNNNYNQRIRALRRENEKKLKEIKEQRSAAIKDMASGVLESGGALYGATAGAIIGGADGNLDETIQGLMAGAGLGDSAGKAILNVGVATGGFVSRRVSGIKTTYHTAQNIRSNYGANRDGGSGISKSALNAVMKELKETQFQVSKYNEDIETLKAREKLINSKVDNAND